VSGKWFGTSNHDKETKEARTNNDDTVRGRWCNKKFIKDGAAQKSGRRKKKRGGRKRGGLSKFEKE